MVKMKNIYVGAYMFLQLFGMACKLSVALKTDMRSRRVSIIQPSLFYFSPRIS